ncbi:MAG: nitrous oxide reductase family maturation protein NosD, partial [Promethearchaeota archaeon]
MRKFGEVSIIMLMILGILLTLSPIITYNLCFSRENSEKRAEYSYGINLDDENLKTSALFAPIHIDDSIPVLNWSTARDAGKCTGNGTYSEPYVIKDLVIDGGGSENCILIENSIVYFRIENCTLYNAGILDSGIELNNVDNSQLIDNNCSFNRRGIYLYNSNNHTISGNMINNNEEYGIWIRDGNNINIFGNNMNDNRLGILLSGVNHSISGNIMNGCGLGVSAASLIEDLCSYDIDTTNLVNEKPLYYYSNEENLGVSDFMNAGQILLVNCTNSIISNLDFSFCSNGIALYYCSTNKITGNTGDNQITGIMLFYSYNNIVSENIENSNDYYGIYIAGGYNNSVIGNTANSNERYGIYLVGSNNNTLSGNSVSSNYDDGIYLDRSDYNSISGNTANSNMVGIRLGESNNNSISGNTANSNVGGIYLEHGCNNNTITQNMIKGNSGIGLTIEAGTMFFESSENSMFLNCFIDNGMNAYDEGANNYWDNGIKGNYWDDYNNTDSDGDGIGDVPYNITGPGGSQDRFPL